MRKIKLYIAISLNGKIAKTDGSVDWIETIPNPEKSDFGYAEFYDSVDTTLMGFSTYNQIIQWGIPFPYKGKKNYVLTRNQKHQNTIDVDFISENHLGFINQLKQQEGKDIWLIGGGQVNSLLLNAGLIDELIIFVMPVIIEGIELFGGSPLETHFRLSDQKAYSNGVVEMKYHANKPND